jgi:hypothetical protein
MKRLIGIAILLCAVSLSALAIEAEPDWKKRRAEIEAKMRSGILRYKVGDRVTVIQRVGGLHQGTIKAIDDHSVKVGVATFKPEDLTDESCDKLFPAFRIKRKAGDLLLRERSDYASRKMTEQMGAGPGETRAANTSAESSSGNDAQAEVRSEESTDADTGTVATWKQAMQEKAEEIQQGGLSMKLVLAAVAFLVFVILVVALRRSGRKKAV